MKYQLKSSVLIENVGIKEQDDVMIQDENGGNIYVINWSAGYILRLLQSPCDPEEIAKQVALEFHISEEEVKGQVEMIVETFVRKGFVEEIPS